MTDPQPAPPTVPAPTTAGWMVEATLVVVLLAHVLSSFAMRLTAAAMPLFFVDACVFGPLGIGLAIAGAREANRRTSHRGRLVVLVLLVAGSTSLTPCLSGSNLEAGAMRDLERAGGAALVVTEGRALLERWAAEKRPPGAISATEWPVGRELGLYASYDGSSLRVKSYGMGDFAGFVILPPGAAPVGRPIADGLCWWSPVEHGSIGRR